MTDPRVRAARARLSKTASFRSFMGPVVLNVRQGFFGKAMGYRTRSGGHPRARVRTASYSKCVAVNWGLGDDFNDAHYRDLLEQVFLRPFLGLTHGLHEDVRRIGDGLPPVPPSEAFAPRWWGLDGWWHGAAVSWVGREVGNNARWLCEQAFDAVRTARDNPDEMERVRRQDKNRRVGVLRKAVRGALEYGVTRREISDVIDRVIVEDVMDA